MPTRILKTKWSAPRIDRRKMNAEGDLGPWITDRLTPKIILATQTKIIEVFVDAEGRFVPSLPLISVVPKSPYDLWRIAAALASPVTTAIVMQKYAGAALSVEAIRLSAKQVLALPTPEHNAEWDHAAVLLRQAHEADAVTRRDMLIEYAAASIRAFGVAHGQSAPLLKWWIGRLRDEQASEEASDGE